jgi:hypothetical protein
VAQLPGERETNYSSADDGYIPGLHILDCRACLENDRPLFREQSATCVLRRPSASNLNSWDVRMKRKPPDLLGLLKSRGRMNGQ